MERFKEMNALIWSELNEENFKEFIESFKEEKEIVQAIEKVWNKAFRDEVGSLQDMTLQIWEFEKTSNQRKDLWEIERGERSPENRAEVEHGRMVDSAGRRKR